MIDDKIRKLIDGFCKKNNITDYIGIIVYGSYVGERSNELSDLDVMVIKRNYGTQDCGSVMIDGVRVEYFIQSLDRIYSKIQEEVTKNELEYLTKFATCEIYFDTDDRIKNLIQYAKNLYNNKIVPFFDDKNRYSIFAINNRLEDLESLINDDSFYSVYFITLERIRVEYAKINGIISLPVMKIEKIYRDAEFAKKYIASSSHKLPSQEFIDLYLECLKIKDKTEMLKDLKKLYNYCFAELGFDASNFCLKFPFNAPFKV